MIRKEIYFEKVEFCCYGVSVWIMSNGRKSYQASKSDDETGDLGIMWATFQDKKSAFNQIEEWKKRKKNEKAYSPHSYLTASQ